MELAIQIVAFYAALNALIMLALAFSVVRRRVKAGIMLGDGGDQGVLQAMRAHSNNVEYVPMGLILLFVLSGVHAPHWLLHALGAALTVGRIMHGIGLSRGGGVNALRSLGALLT